jgi:lipopolysaccharide transport protein LptA
MKRLLLCVVVLSRFAAADMLAQESTSRSAASPAAAKPTVEKRSDAAAKPAEKDPLKAAFGGSFMAPSDQPITTEIYADQAFFDSQNYVGTFSGNVIVNDPRFNLQAQKLTVQVSKGEPAGLEKVIAEGNVAMLREQPPEPGKPPMRTVGRAEKAVYTTKDGNIELTGTPRVQSGLNMHVATSPDTVMIINQTGQLTTNGPSRTELRQEPKAAPTPKP